MKKFLLLVLLVGTFPAFAASDQTDEWQASTLSDSTIANIQKAKYNYLTCITQGVKKHLNIRMDTRQATDQILKECEQSLTKIRSTFEKEGIPIKTADRYLKRTRTQTARKVLQEMQYAAAKQ